MMVPSVWLLVAFIAGTATGALLVSIHRVTNISKIRDEFKTELESLTESAANPVQNAEPQEERRHNVA